MWRPKNWQRIIVSPSEWQNFNEIMYEAGADAMLEALRKEGAQFDLKEGDVLVPPPAIVTNLLGRPIGKMVFIPSEEVKK